MNKKELGLFLAVAAATGFVGGNVGRLGSYLSVAQADQPAQEVVAHRFVLVDDNGNRRAELAVKGDQAYLVIFGPSQQPASIGLSANSRTAYLTLHDRNDKPRIAMAITPDGRYANLVFFDANGKAVATYPQQRQQ